MRPGHAPSHAGTPVTVTTRAARAIRGHAEAAPTRWLRIERHTPETLAARWLDPASGRPDGTERACDIHEAFTQIERIWDAARLTHADLARPAGGWLGRLRYPIGFPLEPTACRSGADPGPPAPTPLIDLLRCDAWSPTRAAAGCYALGPVASHPGRHAFTAGVRRVLEYLRAGDAFQINLAHRLSASFEGDPAAAYADLARAADPLFGAYIETPATETGPAEATLSCSPELFLAYDATTRRVETRPMKGTRPIGADPEELRHAAKDHAELAMIVDLMRNDLGRVCTPGTLEVTTPRAVERHAERGPGGVLQATATVAGTLAPHHHLADLLAAAFPPGSVTGAPKVRAMQIINELEPFDRGLYCGATLWLGDDGHAELAVAIRTATITEGRLIYPVGAGIVIDSDPDAEWAETLVKAGVLRALGAQLPE